MSALFALGLLLATAVVSYYWPADFMWSSHSPPPFHSVAFRESRGSVALLYEASDYNLAGVAARFHAALGGGPAEFAAALPQLVPIKIVRNGVLIVVAHDGTATQYCYDDHACAAATPVLITAKHLAMPAPFPQNLLRSLPTAPIKKKLY